MVIDEQGNSLGTLNRDEALKIAQERGLDLAEVNPAANPPVARILDYGKYAYEQQKKERKARSAQKGQEFKHVQIKYTTSPHDLETKSKRVEKFLEKGYRVRVEIFLRGREKAHQNLAKERLQRFVEGIEGEFKVIENLRKTPRGFHLTIVKL